MKIARVERIAGDARAFRVKFECDCSCVVGGERGDGERTIRSAAYCEHIEDMSSGDLVALMSDELDKLGRFAEHADGIVCVCGAATWTGVKCNACGRKRTVANDKCPGCGVARRQAGAQSFCTTGGCVFNNTTGFRNATEWRR